MTSGRLGWMLFFTGLLVMTVTLALFLLLRAKPERLVIATVEIPTVGLLFVAEAGGFFADEGVDVTFKSFATGRDALAATLRGEADIATVYETPTVINLLNGEPVGIVSTLHQSSRNTALVARKDRNIRELSDLVGKRVGVTFNTSGAFFLYSSLTSRGIALSQVSLVDVRPDRIVSALQSGEVDAVATWTPLINQAIRAVGKENATLYYSDVYTEISLLAGHRDVLTARRETLVRLLRALLQAEAMLVKTPDAAYAMIAQRLKIPEGEMRDIRGTFTPILTLDNILLTILRQEAAWFVESGKMPGPVPDFRPFLLPGILESVKPEYVTIL